MALRIKWYKATALDRGHVDRLLAGFIKDEYLQGKRWGFENVVLRGATVDAEYVERFETTIKVEDRVGNILELPSIQYDRFFFSIGTKLPNLETHGAPRALGSFFNQVASYLNFRIAIEPLNVDLAKWVSAIERKVDSAFVGAALVSNLPLSNSVGAKIAFTGASDVRPFVKLLTREYSCVFTKMQVVGTLRSQTFKCELWADGRASILSGVEAEIVKMLRRTFREAVETRPDSTSD